MPLPRVNYNEVDQSSVPVALLNGAHGVIVPTLFGPVDKPYKVISVDNFKKLFGGADSVSSPFFAQIRRALKRGVVLFVQRLLPSNAVGASHVFVGNNVTLNAKWLGVWGDAVQFLFHASTGAGDPYTLTVNYAPNTLLNEVWSADTFDNLMTAVNAGSNLVDFTTTAGYTTPATVAVATALTGGSDGSFADAAAKDTAVNTAFTLFNDTVGLDTISAPGVYTHTTYQNLKTYVEARADLIGLYELDPTLTPSGAIAANLVLAEKSSWVAVYYGSSLTAWSPEEQKDVAGPVLFDVMGVFAYNDTSGSRYKAPAGANRGLIPDVKSFAYNMLSPARSDDANTLADAAVNIVGAHPTFGPVVWGAKTRNQANSSLDSIHVRRMLIDLHGKLMPVFQSTLFEPNNPKSWRLAFGKVKPILQDLERQEAIYPGWIYTGDQDASKIQDAIYNQALDLANGIYKVKITLVAQGYIDQLDATVIVNPVTTLFSVNPAA